MKNIIYIILFNLLCFSALSQDNYSFGYKDGFTKGCNCYDNPPNTASILKKGGYDLGYSDGQIEGRFYKIEKGNSQTETRKNPYENIPMYKPTSSPYLQQGMALKQQLLNSRRSEIQLMYNYFWEIVELKTKRYEGNIPKSTLNYIQEVDKLLQLYSTYDLSNDSTWRQIVDFYNLHKNNILNW